MENGLSDRVISSRVQDWLNRHIPDSVPFVLDSEVA